MRRVFLFVLDSLGAGQAADAGDFGDAGAFTLRTLYDSGKLHIPNLLKLGLGNIDGLSFLGGVEEPTASYGRFAEDSRGRDTVMGHWELMGCVSEKPFPVFPDGFPGDLIKELEDISGHTIIGNIAASGTEIIKTLGQESIEKNALIVYTSADSVLQVAAHENRVSLQELYDICQKFRDLLTGDSGVGRVIARPFTGFGGAFYRLPDRKDFCLLPPTGTYLDELKARGLDVIGVGKIRDIFGGRGLTDSVPAHNNEESMAGAMAMLDRDFRGLCFVNLVDFDMLYGHRRDTGGYVDALNALDTWLPGFLQKLRPTDLAIFTADHGCDPGYAGSDHTRESIPALIVGGKPGVNLRVRQGFAGIGATVAEALGVTCDLPGRSFWNEIKE